MAALAASAGCAAATTDTGAEGGATGGRYRVLIPDLAVEAGADASAGQRIARDLRGMVAEMATHTAVAERDMRRAMGQYNLAQLDAITSRQLAQQMNVENVLFGQVSPGGAGLQAEVRFVDVRSGDEILLDGITAAEPRALAQEIFARVEGSIEGIRQAAFCNDYLSSQQFERALENCEQALAVVPNSTSGLYGKATALLNLERYDEALAVYQQLLEIDPVHEDGLLGAGLAASRLERTDVAMGFYNRYMEVNPGNPQVRMTVANDIAKTGDYVSAFRMLEPAIAEQSDNTDYQRYVFQVATAAGQKVQEQENRQAAQPYYRAALDAYAIAYGAEDAELDATSLRLAIAANNALGNSQEALRLARQATERFGTDAATWSLFAQVLKDAGQRQEEVRALTRVIELDPDYQDVYIRRALAYMEAGNRQAAVNDLERAASRGDRANVANVLYSMGGTALRAENFSEASNLLSMAHGYAGGARKNEIGFFWGYSLYKQGETIAKANAQGNATQAQRALELFRRALPLVQASGHANAPQVISATQQYIENQEAIIRASRGR